MSTELYKAAVSGEVAALEEMMQTRNINILAHRLPTEGTQLYMYLPFMAKTVEMRDEDGKTALHYAVENAKVGVVRYLVSFARVINKANKNGYTALDIANQKYEEEPLSPYFAIRRFLRRRNAIEGVEGADQRREISEPFPSEERYSTTINSLSVCATLVASVTFQAAFSLPPNEKVNKILSTPLSRRAFQSFVLLDWLAFCISILAAILLAYATFFRRHRSFVVGVSAFTLPLALYMMMFSFSLGIFLQLRDDYYMLAAYFYYAMFILAPSTMSVIFVVLYNALGYRIPEFIRVGLFEITSFGVFKRIIRFPRPS
ncbi:hypothetical protein SUGI_0424900 [Cryptomeria japonica]|nr:hypothetical protein SUGI_0424900 [Cryptomeria japonica]